MKAQAEQLARSFEETRAATLRLFDLCDERDLHESPGFGYRPIIWHLAHIGVFEAYWLVQKAQGLDAPDARYERVFDPISTPREESKNLPSRAEMESYLARVRDNVLGYLEGFDFDSRDPIKQDGYVFQLVLEHERQHQETLCYLFQLLDPSKKTRPRTPALPEGAGVTQAVGALVSVPAGEFLMGASQGSFAYDNEYPARELFLPEFRIARAPVTNGEFARFVGEGGYERREFWT